MTRHPWLFAVLAACGAPVEGTFVGNPGNLTLAPAGTAGATLDQGEARLAAVAVVRCDGERVPVDPPEGRITLRFGRTPTGLSLPEGRWCGLDATVADLRMDLLAGAPVRVAIPRVDLRLTGELVVTDEKVGLVLGHAGWLLPAFGLAPGPDGVIEAADDPAVLEGLIAAIEQGSSLYTPAGLALAGSGFDVLVPPPPGPETCGVDPTPVGPVIQDCVGGYEISSYIAESTCDPQLWVAGVYQTRNDHSAGYHPQGRADVAFLLPGEHVLALSAYEPTTWDIRLGPETSLTRVLVAGYHEQTVAGVDGVPVEYVSGPACGYAWPDDGQGCGTEALLDAFARAAGVPVTRYDGCYDATSFRWE